MRTKEKNTATTSLFFQKKTLRFGFFRGYDQHVAPGFTDNEAGDTPHHEAFHGV